MTASVSPASFPHSALSAAYDRLTLSFLQMHPLENPHIAVAVLVLWISGTCRNPPGSCYYQNAKSLSQVSCMVPISGYLSPLLGSLFFPGPAVWVPRRRTGPAHCPCFYITPLDRRKISNCFHTRPNSRDLCPSKLQVKMTRAANSMFYCRELLCVHLLVLSVGWTGATRPESILP